MNYMHFPGKAWYPRKALLSVLTMSFVLIFAVQGLGVSPAAAMSGPETVSQSAAWVGCAESAFPIAMMGTIVQSVSFRSSPEVPKDIYGNYITLLGSGETVWVMKKYCDPVDGGIWLNVRRGADQEGWVKEWVLKVDGTRVTYVVPGTNVQPTATPAAGSSTTTVLPGNTTAPAQVTPVCSETSFGLNMAAVVVEPVSFRSTPKVPNDVNSNRLGSLNKGENVWVLDVKCTASDGVWLYVRRGDGTKGWAKEWVLKVDGTNITYLAPVGGTTTASTDQTTAAPTQAPSVLPEKVPTPTGVACSESSFGIGMSGVVAEPVRLRSTPEVTSNVDANWIGSLTAGETIWVMDVKCMYSYEGVWLKLRRATGQIGWAKEWILTADNTKRTFIQPAQ